MNGNDVTDNRPRPHNPPTAALAACVFDALSTTNCVRQQLNAHGHSPQKEAQAHQHAGRRKPGMSPAGYPQSEERRRSALLRGLRRQWRWRDRGMGGGKRQVRGVWRRVPPGLRRPFGAVRAKSGLGVRRVQQQRPPSVAR